MHCMNVHVYTKNTFTISQHDICIFFVTCEDHHIVSSNKHTAPKISKLFSQTFPENAMVNIEFEYNVSPDTDLLKVYIT